MNRYTFPDNIFMIRMTERKMCARNTHTEIFPINEQLIPYEKEKCVLSKEEVILPKKTSLKISQHIMYAIFGFFMMAALVYPVLILPGLMIVVVPIEVVIADRVYGEIIKTRTVIKTRHHDVSVTDTVSDNTEQDRIRVSVYGKRAPA
jgi:hypothetical protein